jgi:two-component system, NarL family, sensor kinase
MSSSNAQIYILILAGIALMTFMVAFVIFMVFFHRQKQLKNHQDLLMIKAEYEHTILKVEKEIQEQTLHYIGQELHDNIGQMLSLTKLNLSQGGPEQLFESKKLITQTIREVRSLSKALNLSWIDTISVKEFIEKELEKIEKTGFCKTELESNSTLEQLEKDKKLVLVRLSQECLNNAIKHARPKLIRVSINESAEKISLTVSDNGKGFDVKTDHNGLGLHNLHSRMKSIGGTAEVKSSPNQGTSIQLVLPM